MARNFDPYHRIRQRMDTWEQGRRFGPLRELRQRLYRSPRGKFLGVFRGIAESMGFNVCVTRIIGCFILLTLTDFFGAHGLMVTLLVGGFFYLLAALLMQAPRGAIGQPVPVAASFNAGSPPSIPRPRVDLAQLDRQLDQLNHRIQRMEGIVTDRQFDWERRMDS